MRIIITPAKRVKKEVDYFSVESLPVYQANANLLLEKLKQLDLAALQRVLRCNQKIAKITYDYYHQDNHELVPALFAFEGIQYQKTLPDLFSDEDYQYLKEHLRILSGLYGVLRPFDGIISYRLELNDPLAFDEYKNLYAFWQDKIYQEIVKDDQEILDLGAKQYTRIIKKYIDKDVKYVKCYFMETNLKEIGVYVKQARGAMVRYLVENKVNCFEKVKDFKEMGYCFNEELSSDDKYIFVRKSLTAG